MPILEINGREVEVDEGFLKMSLEQQNATVDEIAASLAQQKPPSLRETISEASPLVGAALRGVQQIPQAAAQFGLLMSSPYTGQNPAVMEQKLAESPVGGAFTMGQPSEREKQIAGQNPVQSIVGEALGTALIGPAGTAGKLPVAARMGEAAFQGALGSQLAATETPEERVANLQTGAALGPLFRAGAEGAGALVSPLRKYMPFGDKSKLAAVELQEARGGRTAAEERAVYNRVAALFGKEDADKLSLYDITGDPAAKNKAVAYAMAQGPEGTRMIQEAAAAKSAAIENKLRSYTENLRLSKREGEYVKKLQQELLPNTNVSANDFNEITSDPVVKNFLLSVNKARKDTTAAPESILLFQAEVGGMRQDSAGYLDAVRKRLQDKRFAADTTRTEAEFYRKAVQKIDNALDKATEGRYADMKSLQQRQLLTRELDNEFSSVLKTLREGESVPDLKEVKKIFKGKNFQELTQEASRLKDGPRRAKAERSLQLIQHFVRDADPDSVVKQLGKGEIASPEGGGAATLVVKPVGRFLRGEYNREMAYLIDHPEQYVKELEKIAEGPTASRLPEFARLLGRIQAEEASGE